MQSTRIFDGKLLRATLFQGGADKLFVSFRQRIGQDGAFDDAQPVQRFVKAGYAHLHLQSRFNDWYINDETEALEQALEALGPYQRRVGIGFSMGGYAAMRFAPVLGLQHLIAVSAQYTIDPALVPNDRRYRKHAGGFDPLVGRIAQNGSLKGAIIYDPTLRFDKMHALELQRLCPLMTLTPLWGGGHPATGVIGSRRRFPRVQQELLEGSVDCDVLRATHRHCRRESGSYWTHLAKVAYRLNHVGLADFALSQAEALGFEQSRR